MSNPTAEEVPRPEARIKELEAENERLAKALRQIEKTGHGVGAGWGYTCADIAEAALAQEAAP